MGTWGASGCGPTRCHLGRNRRAGFHMTITSSHRASVVSGTDHSLRDRQSAEIEQLLVTAAEEVDPRRSQLLEQAIILGAPMARTLATRYCRGGVDTDDLVQVAYVGLVKAAHGYAPDQDTDFRSYAIP